MIGGRLNDGWIHLVDLDDGPAGRGQHAAAFSETVRIIGQDAQVPRPARRRRIQPHPQPVTGQDRHRRIVCGPDRVEAHPQHLGEKRQVIGKA